MVYEHSGNGWAQSGTTYEQHFTQNGTTYSQSCVLPFAQQSSDGVSNKTYYLAGHCVSAGDANRYWQQVIRVPGSYRIRSNIDSTYLIQSTWSPFAVWNVSAANYMQIQFAGEAWYYESSVPGTATVKQDFGTMQVQWLSDDSWHTTCSNAYLGTADDNDPPKVAGGYDWKLDAPACNHVRIWSQ